jgi:hypothetical protein
MRRSFPRHSENIGCIQKSTSIPGLTLDFWLSTKNQV